MSLDDYSFGIEKFSNILWESHKLYKEHHDELFGENVTFNPDVPRYYQFESLDCLAVFTIRDKYNRLVGYSYFILMKNHNNLADVIADNTLFFVTKSHRKGWLASKFIKFCENKLFKNGFTEVRMHSKSRTPFDILLQRSKYQQEEVVYVKKKE